MLKPPDPTTLLEVRTGKPKPFGGGRLTSAIQKDVRSGAVGVTTLGLEGDEQADRNFHGGPDKAVLHYASENYAAWRDEAPAQGALFCAGAFGENLVSSGINETNVCVGDIFEVGSAVLQVTQPRQPCFKLNHRFGLPSMARRVQETGRTGWYYRVLSPGPIAAGDVIKLASRPHSDWTLRRVQHVLYVDTLNDSSLRELIDLPALSEAMRKILAGRLTAASPESWDARLIGLDPAGATVGDEDRRGWRILRVDAVTQETPSVKSFRLVDPSGAALTSYPPGGHVRVELSNGIVRSYSLCGPPSGPYYEIAVKRVADSLGGSGYLHEAIKPGDIVSVSPPRDRFALASGTAPHVMIAGGIGITPFLSMIEECLRRDCAFELHYCVRTRTDVVFSERVHALPKKHVTMHYSQEPGSRRLDVAELIGRLPPDADVYCCGPETLMRAVRDETAQWKPNRVHFERFLANDVVGASFKVKIASTGALIDVDPRSSILQALRRAGLSIASSCETGSCGTCCIGLLDGDADHRDVVLSEEQRRDQIAVCVSRARGGTLTLDL
jgi:MOSC domain-containing protein YiiM/ferredoxin-NADP reductase